MEHKYIPIYYCVYIKINIVMELYTNIYLFIIDILCVYIKIYIVMELYCLSCGCCLGRKFFINVVSYFLGLVELSNVLPSTCCAGPIDKNSIIN